MNNEIIYKMMHEYFKQQRMNTHKIVSKILKIIIVIFILELIIGCCSYMFFNKIL